MDTGIYNILENKPVFLLLILSTWHDMIGLINSEWLSSLNLTFSSNEQVLKTKNNK